MLGRRPLGCVSPSTSDPVQLAQSKLAAGDMPAAIGLLGPIIETDPSHEEALYLMAVVQRYGKNFDTALTLLERLKYIAPLHGRAHQEEGHVYRDMAQPDRALVCYQRAIRLNPALVSSLQNQQKIFASRGQERSAISLQAQVDRLQKLPKPLLAAMELNAQGKLLKAEELCRTFLKKNPTHIEGMRILAEIGAKLGVLDDADFLLESALEFDPSNAQVHMDYVQILRKRQKFEAALEESKKLLARNPNNAQFKSIYAIESMQTGDFDTALKELDEVLAAVGDDAPTLTTKGHALKTCGRAGEAIASYRQAMMTHPEHGEAYYSLANLKTYEFEDSELAQMQKQEQNADLGYMDRVYLYFALAKAHEDRQDYETAFAYYERGNYLKKVQSRYDADRMREEFDAMQANCTHAFFEARKGFGDNSPDPIFVLGLPRAGSTLIEQILSSHSQIDGTLELPNILALSQRLRRRSGYPEGLGDLTSEECREFGRAFIEDTRIHRNHAPFFIDKMPNNFRHIGLIKIILPNAKIIDARRDPMSCCFSGYKQLFAEGQEFTYGLEDVGRYYSDYVELMDHWNDVLPGFVLHVQHEDVVNDLEGQVRRMLDFLGLPFEKACLSYYETERNVRTPSSEQVRQPIFRDGLDQWRNFDPWLQPLKDALGTHLEPVSTEE